MAAANFANPSVYMLSILMIGSCLLVDIAGAIAMDAGDHHMQKTNMMPEHDHHHKPSRGTSRSMERHHDLDMQKNSASMNMMMGHDRHDAQLKPTQSLETYDLYQINLMPISPNNIKPMPDDEKRSITISAGGGTGKGRRGGPRPPPHELNHEKKEKPSNSDAMMRMMIGEEFAMCKASMGECANMHLACPRACVDGFYGGGEKGGYGASGHGQRGGLGSGGGHGLMAWPTACKYDCLTSCTASCQS